MFACLFLVPDLSLLLFVHGSNPLASVVYNLLHSYVLPIGLGGLVLLYPNKHLGDVSIIWISHISFDRMLGYGLKYPRDFKFSHLQSVGSHDAAG
jgi:hypothetical protein